MHGSEQLHVRSCPKCRSRYRRSRAGSQVADGATDFGVFPPLKGAGSLADLYRHDGTDAGAIMAAAQVVAAGRPIRHSRAL
jgi:hypothetical protein